MFEYLYGTDEEICIRILHKLKAILTDTVYKTITYFLNWQVGGNDQVDDWLPAAVNGIYYTYIWIFTRFHKRHL
jgi:hypothetical protein